MSEQAAPLTRGESVYQALRRDILGGRLRPGTKLRFADLCTSYSASMSVLREGLSRLSEQGLVVAEPQHGFHVTPLSVADLRDLTDARVAIEGLVLAEAVENGEVEWEARVVASHHLLDRTAMLDPDDPENLSEEWVLAHSAFHAALLSGCPNQRLQLVAASLRDAAELYRRWSVPLGDKKRRDIPHEHRAIVDAVLSRDAERAVQLLVEHISRTAVALLDGGEFSKSC